MRSFDEIQAAFPWEEIPGCPGRYRLSLPMPDRSPWDLAGDDAQVLRLTSAACKDPIELVQLPGGAGLLCYRRADGAYVHTLNTRSGLLRKLAQLRPVAAPNNEDEPPSGARTGTDARALPTDFRRTPGIGPATGQSRQP